MVNGDLNFNIIDKLILMALREDINYRDITTMAILKEDKLFKGNLICKEDGVLAGIEVFKRVFILLDRNVEFKEFFKDGDKIKKGDIILEIKGRGSFLLEGERVALNYLQRMCAIATKTRNLVEILNNKEIKILDTRKTTPNMRILEKYSVTVGGGFNHRFNLSDGILIKDNHIDMAKGVSEAINLVRENLGTYKKIEIEVENIEMLISALDNNADIIMLDNMPIEMIKEAIKIIDKKAIIEVSGNINENNIKNYSNLNIDYISSGDLTYGVKSLDLSLKNFKEV